MHRQNLIINEEIQNRKLYVPSKKEDLAKYHVPAEHAEQFKQYFDTNGYQELPPAIADVRRMCIGGLIITNETLGERIASEFNTIQYAHLRAQTFAHKILCQRNDEAIALLFLTVQDFVGDDFREYKNMPHRELLSLVKHNIRNIIEDRIGWVVAYSKQVLRDYYSVGVQRLKIKLNFIMDDGVIKDELEVSQDEYVNYLNTVKGGLLLNGLIDELIYYDDMFGNVTHQNYGAICQVLAPSGFPESKKWIQIDVGITFTGKRLHGESYEDALARKSKEEIFIHFNDKTLFNNKASAEKNKLDELYKSMYFGGIPQGLGYDGFYINIFEVLYADQVQIVENWTRDYTFCKCAHRAQIIESHRDKVKKMSKKSI